MKNTVYTLLFSLLFLHNVSFAQVDPAIDWKVLRLPHFDLIYDASQQELADFYAPRLESHLSTLNLQFDRFPSKVALVLNDNSDLTNGFATPIPYNQIQIFPVLPGPQETIGEYGDWAHEVSLHEYVHVLSFQHRRGVVNVLYSALGSIITPTMLLPRWFLEGIAVEFETRFSTHGRLRSSTQDANLRALFLSDRFQETTLAEINETSLHTYPQGARPYLFGSLMWSEIIANNKIESAKNLHESYGGRMPFFLNGPAEEFSGKTFEAQLEASLDDTGKRIQSQLQILKSKSPTVFANLNWTAPETFSPTLSPDGKKMAYISKGENLRRAVKILERTDLSVPFRAEDVKEVFQQHDGEGGLETSPLPRKESDGPPGGTINRLSWFPDSQKFLYDRLESRNRYHERSDLFVYDIQTRKSEQISFGLRAREACVSPSGKSALFVQLSAGQTALAHINLQTKIVRIVKSFKMQERVSWPSYVDSKTAVFSLRSEGRDRLILLNLENLQSREILNDFPEGLFPEFGPEGLLFSSTQNGVRNLYLANKDFTSAKALTHSLTGVTSSSLDRHLHDVYLSEWSSDGLKIRRLPALARFSEKQLPSIAPLFADRYPNAATPVPTLSKISAEVDDYSSWKYLLPRYWIPWYSSDEKGWDLSVSIGAADPLAKHSYSLAAAYDSRTKEKNYSFNYLNTTQRTWLLLSALDLYSYVGTTTSRFRNENYLASGLWELPSISTDLSANAGWRWRSRDFQTAKFFQNGPTLGLKYLGYSQTGAQISPEAGWAADFQYSHWLAQPDFQATNLYQASVQNYFSKWLPKRHALFFRLKSMYQDERASAADLEQTYSSSAFANTPFQLYVMRGFAAGQFLAKSLNQATVEYRFPLSYRYIGFGTSPLAFKRFHAAVVADGIQLDGFALKNKSYEAADKNLTNWSGGIELKTDLTFGYHFPFTALFGLYGTLSSAYPVENNFMIGLQSN